MSTLGDEESQTNPHVRLRVEAESRLKEGTAPPTKGWPTGANALSLLYTLASSPDSAPDALKLLHELQVHQVELDLQHEQVEAARRDMAEDLARYKTLFEAAPAAYFNVDSAGEILEGNLAGAELLGLELGELSGRRLESLLAPASRPVLQKVLREMREGVAGASCDVQSGKGRGARTFRVAARPAPGRASFLLVLVPVSDSSRD
jgi:PAS domain S-box-containing protein